MEASVEYALRRPKLRDGFLAHLKGIVSEYSGAVKPPVW